MCLTENHTTGRGLLLLAALLLLLPPARPADAAPAYELTVNQATFMKDGKPAQPGLLVDRFGKGLDGIGLWTGDPEKVRDEVRYVCKDVPEGDYTVGILTMPGNNEYMCFGELFPQRAHLYHNDMRVLWTAHTVPTKALDGAQPAFYQAEMLTARLHVKPGDVFRVLVDSALFILVGPVRLYKGRLDMPVEDLYNASDLGPTQSIWLHAAWTEARRTGDVAAQTCRFFNPGVLPRTITLEVHARDWMMRALLDREEKLTVGPGESATKTYEFKPGTTGRARLSVTATSPGVLPPVRLTKYWVDDLTVGARPTLGLNGDWEMCYVPGVDPGNAPPADAKWATVKVPSEQPTTKGHCAWFRKTFEAPAYLQGERVVLQCDEILSTAAVYLNGTSCGVCRRGSEPFEIDVTAGFKPGQKNEILIAVQDWLAFSPRNRDRVLRGEEPIYKDGMIDVADYDAVETIGIRGPIRLEARPAVSVDDVSVATSVRQKKLTLTYRLLNTGKTDQETVLRPRVLDAGAVTMSLPEKSVRVPAGSSAAVTVEAPWANAHQWWPHDPHLYVLETSLQPPSGAKDIHLERFGFREFWIDGINLVLNGMRVKLRSCCVMGGIGRYSAKPFSEPDKRYEAIWNWQQTCTRDRYLQLVRTHLWSRFREGVDLADESGLMVKLEGGVHQVSFTLDDTFWNAALAYETRLVGIYKNHASVMMWSAGNENMWGWMYQGEAARVLGNRWQIRIAKAMQDADPMRRPVEWEADGDLMGGGGYFSLHYPRELSAFPDLPVSAWWGPLDKKTVIPYSMGPITLGAKPLTVGESYWPANLNHPFGQTILLGDEAYGSGDHEWKGWAESSRFFLHGFRDVEFALTDTYLPLAMLPPQTVILKETTASFFGGRKIVRNLNVHSDVFRPANLTLRWSVTAAGEAGKLAGGTLDLKMQPAGLSRRSLEIQLPAVTRRTDAVFRVELLESGKSLHTETSNWHIYPVASLKAPKGLHLSVYDPAGSLASVLAAMKVPFARLAVLSAPASGALVLGPDSLKQTPPGPWREALASFVRDGGKVVVLDQTEAPDFLPVPVNVARDSKSTMSFVRAADHPLLAGLTDADMRWWYPDHYVSRNNYRKPVSGNWLPLVDIGTMDGLLETPLLEEYDGRGAYVLCQMPVAEKARECPQAARLLQNLLDYLAAPAPFRVAGKTALLAGTNDALRKALDDSKLDYENLGGADLGKLKPESFQVAIVDVASALDEPAAQALRAFSQAGGKVLLHRPTPAKGALLEPMLGVRLGFAAVEKEPGDVQNRVLRCSGEGLLAGVSNHEFFWATKRYLDLLHREGWWWADCGPAPPAEFIADYFLTPADADSAKVVALTRPGTLLQVPVGSGYFLVSELRLDEPAPDVAVTVGRLRGLLLCNLGCTLKAPGGTSLSRAARFRDYDFFTVDLSPYTNRGLRDDKPAGIVGWTNQGENDMRNLPTGRQVFGGVPFLIAAPKAAIALNSVQANNLSLPKEVKGIKVGRRADVLFFLHTIAFDAGTARPFQYRVNYADGSSVDVPIVNGQQVIDWWTDPNRFAEALARGNAFVAWQGDNPMRKGVCLFCHEWVNPHPDRDLRDVDFLKGPEAGAEVVPVLVGLSGATVQADEGVVVDVIGTAGVKVQLGSQVQDIYYIGVVGIPADHPFYARAVAAHKALAVGQKVLVREDVNARNAAGQRIAYVFLALEHYENVRNLLNARVIGDGLGSPGNFEGNNLHRMYLENLGFITKQGKKGMWGTS
jgi:hypothetical protein